MAAAKKRHWCEYPRSQAESGQQSGARHGLPMLKASAMGSTSTASGGWQGAAEAGGTGTGTESVPRAGQAVPEGISAGGPSLGEQATLYFLRFSGKGDENSCGLLPWETPQGPGILRTCPASQRGNGQH